MLEQALHIYFVVAILYNVGSQISLEVSGRQFAPTDPSHGMQVVTVVYLVFLVRDNIPQAAFLFLSVLWFLSIARFGIVNHMLNYSKENYLSRATWLSAMAINGFGVVAMAIYLVTRLVA